MEWRYRCPACGFEAEPEPVLWQCPACAGELLIDGLPDRAVDASAHAAGIWQFESILPVETPSAGTLLGEGDTPLIPFHVDGVTIHLKLDSLLPTGSFKDRGAAVLCQYLKRVGVTRIIVDSSGNAAASMAAYAAATGLECTVYVPASASPGKLVQARAAGACVVPVEGSRDDVAAAAQQAADSDRTASYASHNWHPVFVEGVKTWALETHRQLGGQLPDAVYVPTGGGSALVGAWRGFGAVSRSLPRLIAAQPEACSPIVRAWQEHAPVSRMEAGPTIAEGAKIALPSRPLQIQRALSETDGRGIAVSEELLIDTLKLLWSRGVYVEPTGALGVAACRVAITNGEAVPTDTIVAHVTGHGLKSTPVIEQIMNESV